ncbi:MAG: hypothetical protein AVDCRST_MAG41-1534, partial [uncultured Corynebacteriales bacterium]
VGRPQCPGEPARSGLLPVPPRRGRGGRARIASRDARRIPGPVRAVRRRFVRR